MSDPKDYTVGWICAITAEFTAEQNFLDEKQQVPEGLATADHNAYAVGLIGKHKVVIAVLPDGEYGISSATGVAKDMLHSFPNIKVGLMVGIGGGAPSAKHDIRQGDVVVSASRDGNGGVFLIWGTPASLTAGSASLCRESIAFLSLLATHAVTVFQYDFGKTIQNQSFQSIGVLNQSPVSLRTALSALKSDYEIDGHQIQESIGNILEKKPRLRQNYQRPDRNSDRLYRSEFVHPENHEGSCRVACGDMLSSLVEREERSEGVDDPTIHYGLIASSNQLMKDARI
ncbi:hypothetical protein N7495_001727 [Penicillium taxi]|uniref:uncharacterized protein n=1 Tax=Penicillium taxi TaxID=168475 RepID=UPI002544E935|nr:uncharacterized protein N7495_001727 [Penicillium taxi]KAJ5909045.1 hypothetical protein N7495_001727 [Penicillium taxi]